jgi:DNA-binding transcriptional MocR family regulator
MLHNVIDVLRSRLDEPTSRALANAVSRAVADGALAHGGKLPPIRTVATELGLSPTTVSAAWALLARSGAIRTDGRRGTVIAPETQAGPVRYRRVIGTGARFDIDLSTGVPDPALLPDLGPALLRLQRGSVPQTYLDEPVVPELAEVLRASWPFSPGALTMADGAMDALDLITGCFLRFGDRVAVEHPCFPPLLDLLDLVGVQVVPLDLDDDGPLVARVAAALESGVTAVFLQPRAQNPTGASLTHDRAQALAALLAGRDVLIVENDSAGMVANSPSISLGTWLPDSTLHVRSFSKSHGPDLRLAAIGGAAPLIERLSERRHLGQGWTSRLLQRLLLDLLTDPHSIAQVEQARDEYARRRRLVVQALDRLELSVSGKDGLNLWLAVKDEASALVGLAARGIGAAPGGPFSVRSTMPAHLRVTVGLLGDDDRGEVAAALAAVAAADAWSAPR